MVKTLIIVWMRWRDGGSIKQNLVFPYEEHLEMVKITFRFIPEELIRALQAAYWSIRLIRILF